MRPDASATELKRKRLGQIAFPSVSPPLTDI